MSTGALVDGVTQEERLDVMGLLQSWIGNRINNVKNTSSLTVPKTSMEFFGKSLQTGS